MDFAFSDDQVSLQGLAREILTEQVDPRAPQGAGGRAAADGSVYDAQLWKQLADAGLTGIAVPEEHGGAGLGFLDLAVVFEEIGRAVAPVPAVATLVDGVRARSTSAPTRSRSLLPGVAAGDTILTTALRRACSDVTAPHRTATAGCSTARRASCPTAPRLTSSSYPPSATARTVLALVPQGRRRRSRVTELHTTNHEPQALLDLQRRAGRRRRRSSPTPARSSPTSCGTTPRRCRWSRPASCRAALAMTAKYTSEREQFDKKIASFQAVGQRAADAYIDAEMVRLTALQAAWRLSEGWPADEEIAIAKFWAGDGGMRVVHACQHLHGGLGVDTRLPAAPLLHLVQADRARARHADPAAARARRHARRNPPV